MFQGKRDAITGSIILAVTLGLVIADFLNNGKIDNANFFIVMLFVFGGAASGRTVEVFLERMLGSARKEEQDGEDDHK